MTLPGMKYHWAGEEDAWIRLTRFITKAALSQQFAHEDLDRSVERSDQSYRIED